MFSKEQYFQENFGWASSERHAAACMQHAFPIQDSLELHHYLGPESFIHFDVSLMRADALVSLSATPAKDVGVCVKGTPWLSMIPT